MADPRSINLTNNLKKDLKNFMTIYYRLEEALQQWNDLGLSDNVTDEDLEGTGITAAELTSVIVSIQAIQSTLITDNNSDNLNKLVLG